MKEQKLYVCDHCGTQYKDKNDCKGCEDGHKIPVAIDTASWVSIKQNGSGYPTKVHVAMSNGETITYNR
ncbi:hypothetical protein SAMN02746066_04356 [Anaerosporobacter mobilis DSM 15930]|uniref:Uncharacterized protein n=1 Tax=Anaerosporobacter mobilis DSM 15930 TaxID=1120996 RepID=A0A1M7NC12_9FIRM|nr:hypothetical protein [Anaerosporobacter mobilis]SHN01229.1 hypothetical protein SAMN02746066_04356 [Anaerosporobacter mobilis DSM 15930]